MRRPVLALLAVLAAAVAVSAPARASTPPVRHVFLVVLENKSYDETFGSGGYSPYLSNTLTTRGALLPNYYGVTHVSLGNYIAMLSGQGSNPQTQSDCQFFTPFLPGTFGANGQALGTGCVYPSQVKTLADQLQGRGLTWKGYMEDMGTACRHPTIGTRDTTQSAKVGDQYAARHNPFVYFQSLLSSSCAQRDVDFKNLPNDLRSTSTTPNFSFITPNLCDDGHDSPCVDKRPGGLVSSDAFLKAWIPRIQRSPAYKKDGLIVITWDEAEAGGALGDATSCCGETTFPNTANNGATLVGTGGGRIGAVLLSRWIDGGTISHVPYNHFSFLKTVEDLFGLGHLGYAGTPNLQTFGSDVYTCYDRRAPKPVRRRYRRGGLIRRATVSQGTARHATVEVRLRQPGRARVELRRGKRFRRVGRAKTGQPCAPLRFVLPRGHGRARVVATTGRGSEMRTVAY